MNMPAVLIRVLRSLFRLDSSEAVEMRPATETELVRADLKRRRYHPGFIDILLEFATPESAAHVAYCAWQAARARVEPERLYDIIIDPPIFDDPNGTIRRKRAWLNNLGIYPLVPEADTLAGMNTFLLTLYRVMAMAKAREQRVRV